MIRRNITELLTLVKIFFALALSATAPTVAVADIPAHQNAVLANLFDGKEAGVEVVNPPALAAENKPADAPEPPAQEAGADKMAKDLQEKNPDRKVIVVEENEERPPWYMRFLHSFEETLPKTVAGAIGGLLGWFVIEVGKALLDGVITVPWVGVGVAVLAGIAVGFLAYYLIRVYGFKDKDKKSGVSKHH